MKKVPLVLVTILFSLGASLSFAAEKKAGRPAEPKGGGKGGAVEERRLGPDHPRIPDVDFKDPTKDNGPVHGRKVVLGIAGGASLTAELIMRAQSVPLCDPTGGSTAYVRLDDIRSLEFLRWKGRQLRRNEYGFYPAAVRVKLKNGNSFECGGTFDSLHRLNVKINTGQRSLYSYYYDYRKNDAWVNSGGRDMGQAEASPLKGTVVKIEFGE